MNPKTHTPFSLEVLEEELAQKSKAKEKLTPPEKTARKVEDQDLINLHPKYKQKFWDKVDKLVGDNPCWEWGGLKNKGGSGVFFFKAKSILAHRLSWVLTNGLIPHNGSYHGMCVCHKCDNRLCCNPSHLFLGTQYDNCQDRMRKGRTFKPFGNLNGAKTKPWSRARGENNGSSKLTENQVIQIRRLFHQGVTRRFLQKEFGVSYSLIRFILNRKLWRHLPEDG